MNEINNQNPTPAEHPIPSEWYAELEDLPPEERAEQEAAIAELRQEMQTAEAMQREADRYVAEARSYGSAHEASDETEKLTFEFNFETIGWIDAQEKKKVPVEQIETPSLSYWFTDLTGQSNVTEKARDHLEEEGELDKLLELTKQEKIPILWDGVMTGKGRQRSISIGGRSVKDVPADQSLNTSLPAYKIDVQGTNNRAIIVKLGDKEGAPVLGLAALYDHEDQAQVLQKLQLKRM